MAIISVESRSSRLSIGSSKFLISLAIFISCLFLVAVSVPVSAQDSSIKTNAVGPKPSGSCGPPLYPCSRTDSSIIRADHPPQLGNNSSFYGGHTGAGKIAVDPAYGNAMLRVTDGTMLEGESFNTGSSAEKNPWSYDETMFLAHNERSQLCLFQFDQNAFQSSFKGCFLDLGKGGGADFGYTQADNGVFYNYSHNLFYRFVVDKANWTVAADPAFNHGKGAFDPDGPECLDGQMAANKWVVGDHALSSDDNTEIAAIGPQQDADVYFVVWNAAKGCSWLNVTNWKVSQGWNTGLKNPVGIDWLDGVAPSEAGGIHNAQIDRSGAFGVLAVHHTGLNRKMFWTIGTNHVDATCHKCISHWACDFGVCFWDYQKKTSYDMQSQPIGSLLSEPDMDNMAAVEQWHADEHLSHANAEQGAKNMYLAAWQTKHSASVSQVWQGEITGISWDGSQRTVRFNKHWNSGFGGFWGSARCGISHLGHYALCASDYEMDNLDKGFGNGRNQDHCDHTLNDAQKGTNSCRTDLLVFQLN